MNIPNVKEFLANFKANSEKVSQLQSEISILEDDFKTASETISTLKSDASSASEALVASQLEVKERDAKITDLEKQISEFNAAIAEHELKETSAAVEAVKIVKSVGVPAVPITKVGSDESKTNETPEEINIKFQSITDLDEKQKYYAEHRSVILGLTK